jgi:hypothetical protein
LNSLVEEAPVGIGARRFGLVSCIDEPCNELAVRDGTVLRLVEQDAEVRGRHIDARSPVHVGLQLLCGSDP